MGSSDPFTISLTGELPFLLISTAVLAWPVSLGLLKFYRSKVIKTMSTTVDSHKNQISFSQDTETPDSCSAQTHQSQLHIELLDASSTLPMSSTPQWLFKKIIQAPNRLGLVYIGGGLCYALIMTWCYLTATDNAFLLKRFLLLFWLYAWPTALAILFVAASTSETKRLIIAAYCVIFLILSVWVALGNPDVSVVDMPRVWLIYNLGPTILLYCFLTRNIRAVGPLVFSFMVVAMIGSHLALSLASNTDSSLLTVTQIGMALGLNAVGIFIGLILVGFAIFASLGWLLAQYIGKLYKNKTVSDQSITVDALFLLFGIVHPISLVFEGIGWILSGPLAFLGYKISFRIRNSLLGDKPQTSDSIPRLLLLRVFSLGKRSEELFDALGLHWRHAGPIQLIAGPDLATTTVEPHEFLDFLSGKLARRFIDSPETLSARFKELDIQPDQDGRFRVTDFFCHDDTWQMVLSKLVGKSDVILMDLRGFSRLNAGCQYEIQELINVVALEQAVFVIDHTTDESLLQEMLYQFWSQITPSSPNAKQPRAKLTIFRLQSIKKSEFHQLLRIICRTTENVFGNARTKAKEICVA